MNVHLKRLAVLFGIFGFFGLPFALFDTMFAAFFLVTRERADLLPDFPRDLNSWIDLFQNQVSEKFLQAGPEQALPLVLLLGLLCLGLLAIPNFVAAFGLWKGKAWARFLALALGALHLALFPFGTLLGIYAFWVLWRTDIVKATAAGLGSAEPAPTLPAGGTSRPEILAALEGVLGERIGKYIGEELGTGGPREWSAGEVKRLYLKRADSADAPPSVLPEIGGEMGPGGFIQRTGYAGRIIITVFGAFVGLASAIMLAGLLGTIYDGVQRHKWAGLTGVVLVVLPVFYLICRSALPPLRRMFLAQWLNPGSELTIERWPLHLGEETRVIYRSRPRPEWETARVESILQCVESAQVKVVQSVDEIRRRTRHWETRAHIVWQEALPPITPLAELSAAVKAEWKIRIPETGVPSFKAARNAISWNFVVTSHSQDGLEDTTYFELLVRPEVVI